MGVWRNTTERLTEVKKIHYIHPSPGHVTLVCSNVTRSQFGGRAGELVVGTSIVTLVCLGGVFTDCGDFEALKKKKEI